MVQLSDGCWSEKHGTGGGIIVHEFGKNPNNLSWDVGPLKNYYNNKDCAIYIAVTR